MVDFNEKEYSLIGKIRSFSLPVLSSSLSALVFGAWLGITL